MTYYISTRIIDGKPRKVIIDEKEKIINKNPSNDELKLLTIFPEKCVRGSKPKYTKDKLLGFMTKFYKKTGRVPIVADFDSNPNYPSPDTYVKYFGNWGNAIEISGLRARHYNETNTCDRCKENFNEIDWQNPLKEYDEKGDWTGKWDCPNCWQKYDLTVKII